MVTHVLEDLERRLAAGERLTRADGARVFECADLVSVGVIGEQARRAATGDRVTFGRVTVVAGATLPADVGDAGEVRLAGTPGSVEEARARVRAAVAWAGDRPVTAYTLPDLMALCGGDHTRLSTLVRDLVADGLTALAEVPVDRAASDAELIDALRAVTAAGLGAWRLTVERAEADGRMALIERAAAVQDAISVVRAFAPLPRVDRIDTPSTGYDDAKTVAVARLLCPHIASIQVDWPRYGPKLAQVAIAFGANDIDGVASIDTVNLGPRKTPLADIERQIRAAGGEPVERDARYLARS